MMTGLENWFWKTDHRKKWNVGPICKCSEGGYEKLNATIEFCAESGGSTSCLGKHLFFSLCV